MPAPEVGDLDKPKFVFFFDEAHLLFAEAPKVLLDKIEQVVRLVRSKGVGIYFITQNPLDIPDSVLGQLGNRVQHALRAYTPREQKAVKAAAETFRANPKVDVAQAIIELGKQQEAAAARERDREREKERARAEREAGRRYEDRHERHYDYHGDRRRGRPRSTMVEKLARQAVSTAGRELVRGILGSLLR